MRIREHTVIEEYTGKDGVAVVVAFFYPTTAVTVAAYDAADKQIFSGEYNSRAGAMIGIGRRFGRVHFARMYNKEGR